MPDFSRDIVTPHPLPNVRTHTCTHAHVHTCTHTNRLGSVHVQDCAAVSRVLCDDDDRVQHVELEPGAWSRPQPYRRLWRHCPKLNGCK